MTKINDWRNIPFRCFKHDLDYTEKCDKCEAVALADLCRQCEVHKASIDFADSALDAARGYKQRLCLCCYFKRVEEAHKNIIENYGKIKAQLESEGCK